MATTAAYVVNNTVFAAPAAVHTLITAIAPAGHGLTLVEFGISFDGVTASAVPVFVELVTSTQAGAGTAGVTPTATQIRGRTTAGSAPTSGANYTAEPTVLTRQKQWYVTPNNGVLIVQFPLGREIETDSSAGTTKAIGLRITPPATVNCLAYLEVEALG